MRPTVSWEKPKSIYDTIRIWAVHLDRIHGNNEMADKRRVRCRSVIEGGYDCISFSEEGSRVHMWVCKIIPQ